MPKISLMASGHLNPSSIFGGILFMEPQLTPDTKPLWDRADDHGREITQLKIDQAVSAEMLKTHSAQIAQGAKDSSERHGQLIAMLNMGADKMDEIYGEQNRQRGAAGYKIFAIPVVISLLGLLATLGYISGAG